MKEDKPILVVLALFMGIKKCRFIDISTNIICHFYLPLFTNFGSISSHKFSTTLSFYLEFDPNTSYSSSPSPLIAIVVGFLKVAFFFFFFFGATTLRFLDVIILLVPNVFFGYAQNLCVIFFTTSMISFSTIIFSSSFFSICASYIRETRILSLKFEWPKCTM